MNDTLIGIVGLVIIIGAIWLWQKFTSAVGTKVNQNVFQRKGYREGLELTQQEMSFTANGSSEQLRNALRSHVQVVENVPKMLADAFVLDEGDGHITYRCGNKLQTHFTGILFFDESDSAMTGSWKIVNWLNVDGVAASQSVMKRVVADIQSAIKSVDPNARISFR